MQAAGLGTLPPVPAPSSDQTAEQTLSGIAIAECAVDKAFDLHPGGLLHMPDLLQRQLPRRNGTHSAAFLQKPGALCPGDGHLRTGVDIQIRKAGTHHLKHAGILYDHCIQPAPVQRFQVAVKLRQLLILHECIDSQIESSSVQMRFVDRFQKLLLGKVLRICTCTKMRAACIYRIRPCRQRCPEAVI